MGSLAGAVRQSLEGNNVQWKRAIGQAVGVAAAILSFAVNADTPNPEELKHSIEERAHKIAEYRALLNDSDQSVRLAALDVMLKSGDTAMQELAYAVAFASADEPMRAVALKNRIANLHSIVVTIDKPNDASANEKRVWNTWGGTYGFSITTFDEKTGRFATTGVNTIGKGQVAGTTFEFVQQYCTGTFHLGKGAVLQGVLGCRTDLAGQYPGSINVQ
jgi:hypothetical protein